MAVVAECLHDEVCAWSAVEDVAEQVQSVDGQTLDKAADGDNEVIGALGVDDALDNHIVILRLVGGIDVGRLVEQFLYDVLEFLWQFLTDFGASVF